MVISRESLIEHGLIELLFKQFNHYLDTQGYVARKGQIVDATIVPVPRQRNSREENKAIKAGEIPEGWEGHPDKLSQKDTQARWTKKHNKSYYGYKNHVDIDNQHKLIRRYHATDASVHDSQVLGELIDPDNTGADVWADSAYRSDDTERELKSKGYRSRIHHKGKRNKPLSQHKQSVNQKRSTIRARVEHVFGYQENSMGGKLIRTIGLARARAKMGMMNLGYNMKRLVYLQRKQGRVVASIA